MFEICIFEDIATWSCFTYYSCDVKCRNWVIIIKIAPVSYCCLFRVIFICEHEYKLRNIIKWYLVFAFVNSIYTDLSKYSIGNVARCPSSFSITFSLLSLLFCLTDLSLLSSFHQPCHVLSLSFFIVLCKCIGLIKPTLSKHHSFVM